MCETACIHTLPNIAFHSICTPTHACTKAHAHATQSNGRNNNKIHNHPPSNHAQRTHRSAAAAAGSEKLRAGQYFRRRKHMYMCACVPSMPYSLCQCVCACVTFKMRRGGRTAHIHMPYSQWRSLERPHSAHSLPRHRGQAPASQRENPAAPRRARARATSTSVPRIARGWACMPHSDE